MKGKNSKEVEVKRKIADSITIKVGQGIRTIFRDTDTLEKAKKISIKKENKKTNLYQKTQ